MHESFRVEETVPVAPGTSPFRVRGIYYARVLEHGRSLPGGMGQFLDELVDPRVRDFMRQQFHFMNWYDVYPTVCCGAALARIRGRPFEAFMREAGRASMVKLVPSMFRLFSRLGGPRLAASHAPRLFQMYFDFFELRLSRVSDCEGSGRISGVPLYVAPGIINMALGIIAGALESLGAQQIEADYRDVTVSASNSGMDLVSCRGDFGWTLAQKALTG